MSEVWRVRPGDVSPSKARRQLRYLMTKYNGICQYCFKKIPSGLQSREHIKRLIDGGTSDMDNLTLACMPCNSDANERAEGIKRNTEGIQECLERRAKGLPIVGPAKVSHRERIADTWPILIGKGIAGTIRRQQIGAVLVAGAPGTVECSSTTTKKLRIKVASA